MGYYHGNVVGDKFRNRYVYGESGTLTTVATNYPTNRDTAPMIAARVAIIHNLTLRNVSTAAVTVTVGIGGLTMFEQEIPKETTILLIAKDSGLFLDSTDYISMSASAGSAVNYYINLMQIT